MESGLFHKGSVDGVKKALISVNEVCDPILVELSLVYAQTYQRDGKAFISSFLKFGSVRESCGMIVRTWKRMGAFNDCEGDFSEWVGKLKIEEKWKAVLADVLRIIYTLNKK